MSATQHAPQPSLDQLNFECLLTIIEQLSLQDQLSLYNVNEYLRQTVAFIWQRKYAKFFDYAEVINFERTPTAEDELQVLATIGRYTETLVNLDTLSCNLLHKHARKGKIELRKLRTLHIYSGNVGNLMHLQHLPKVCPRLQELQLAACCLYIPEIDEIFTSKCRLRTINILPDVPLGFFDLDNLMRTKSLRHIRLPIRKLSRLHVWLQKLPQLCELTAYIDADSDRTTKQIFSQYCFEALWRRFHVRRVKRLVFACDFHFMLELAMRSNDIDLRELSWQAKTMKPNIPAGAVSDMVPTMEGIIRRASKTLKIVDLTDNVYVTPSFLQTVRQTLGKRYERGEVQLLSDLDEHGAATNKTASNSPKCGLSNDCPYFTIGYDS